ncbi:endonuclease/exonuclease/phosphatase family protein [Mycobacterium sp. ENV421]|uniref:endonuclease/exonuclease/phosphatase family protein n=1 Tax=Mycobacterium sp. ENV421 TaxID=1213407 RepID=UPI001E292D75|nr:endonuclease/exonuclease/phosphatase family protein [Mycobacterium sp. ENV421]
MSNIVGLALSVGSAYAPFIALGGLVLSALSRRIVLVVAAVLVMTTTVALQVPRYFSSRPSAGSAVDLRVLSSNLRKGQADATPFVTLAKTSADVVTASELTPEAAQAFSRAGMGEAFPYAVLFPAPDSGGIGLWSRYPLTPTSPTINGDLLTAVAHVAVPGVSTAPLIASVHIISPLAFGQISVDRWEVGIADAKSLLDGFSSNAGRASVIVAGDFNTTPDIQQFRELLTNGYRDAADQAGVGFVPTFPADSALPPVLAIDHVITRGATATSLKATDVPGSDHRALLVTVRLPAMLAQTDGG